MPQRFFKEEWLQKIDSNGQPIGYKCEERGGIGAWCKICVKELDIQFIGFGALIHLQQKYQSITRIIEVLCD